MQLRLQARVNKGIRQRRLVTLKTTIKDLPKTAIDADKKIALLANLNEVQQLAKYGHYDAAVKLLNKTILFRMDARIKREHLTGMTLLRSMTPTFGSTSWRSR